MQGSILFFSLFLVGILGILIFDLLILGRKSHEVSLREAAIWKGVWVTLALLFALFLRFHGQLIHGIESHEGIKLIAHEWLSHIGYKPIFSLLVISGIFGLSILLSILFPRQIKSSSK